LTDQGVKMSSKTRLTTCFEFNDQTKGKENDTDDSDLILASTRPEIPEMEDLKRNGRSKYIVKTPQAISLQVQ